MRFARKAVGLLQASALLVAAACVRPAQPPLHPQANQLARQPDQCESEKPAQADTALAQRELGSLSAVFFSALLDEWLPGMGAEDILARERPQQQFEQFCLRAGLPGAEADRATLCEVICTRLGPQTPQPARLWMLRQLERLGKEESVPALTELLDDADPLIREAARRALENNPAEKAAEALREALKREADRDWKVALINSLAARRDIAAVPQLAALAGCDARPVGDAAIAALGQIGTAAAADALLRFWHDAGVSRPRATARRSSTPQAASLAPRGGCGSDAGNARGTPAPREGSTRTEAIGAALLAAADRLLHDGQHAHAAAIYAAIYNSSTCASQRAAALRGLATAEPEQAKVMLLEILGGKREESLRAVAARLLGEMSDPDATKLLTTVLPDLPPEIQVVVLHALADRDDPRARPAVLEATEGIAPEVRLAAIEALRQLGTADDVQLLAALAAEQEDELRVTARRTLARLRGQQVDAMMLKHLETAPALVRIELIGALSDRRCRRAVPTLLLQARTADQQVRVAALQALGELADPAQAPELVALLVAADSGPVERAAEDAVVMACARHPNVDRRANPVLAVWEEVGPQARARLVRVLGRLHGPAALEKIRAARRSNAPEIVDAAVRALASWPDTEVLDDLLDLASHSENKTHRVLALQGYIRLLGPPSQRPAQTTVQMYDTAMKLAERPDEQKLVLAGLAEVQHPDALQMAARFLNDQTLGAEAEAAVVSIAELLGLSERELARSALEDIRARTTSETTRKRAEQALASLRRSVGYITRWMISDPYFQAGRDWTEVFEIPFPPEQPPTQDLAWRPLEPTNPRQPWIFDLTPLDAGGQRCVYVRSAIWSGQPQPVRLEVGSDDGVKVWLNGRLVHAAKVARGHKPFEDKIPAVLAAGWNTLLIKVVQAGGAWSFSAAVMGPDGEPLPNLKLQAEPEPTP